VKRSGWGLPGGPARSQRLPKDVQLGACDYEPAQPFDAPDAGCVDKAALEVVATLVKEAKRPYIYCGGGVVTSGASEELMAFADRIDAPVGLSIMGLTAVPYAHPRFLGMVGMHGRYGATKALYECDLLIAVGVRFSDRATGNKADFIRDRKVIQIDIDPAEINKNIGVTTSVIGDVKCVLGELAEILGQQENAEWMERIRYIKEHPDNNLEMNPNI
jgi:acetolactate synthase-1/2/3 large subunit